MALNPNEYLIQDVLGRGSFSKVFKIQHKTSGLLFAGKCLKKVFSRKQDIVNCVEINVMKRIEDHPNILNLKDVICDTFPCKVVLVFELMDKNLYEFLKDKQKPLSESASRMFFYQIVCGIQHLHQNNIFHRDIKPENILLKFPRSPTGVSQEHKVPTVKLGDFGSVKSIDAERPLTGYIATRWYRAPECLLTDGYYGPKLDIWSVGCVFYEMLTLSPLFPGDSDLDQLEKIHRVIGTPSEAVLKRFRHLNTNLRFPKVESTGFSTLVPSLSTLGLIVLKSCLNYIPESRIDSRQLQEHCYFSMLRVPKSARSSGRSNQIKSSSCNKLIKCKDSTRTRIMSPRNYMQALQKKRDSSNNNEEKVIPIMPKRVRKQT